MVFNFWTSFQRKFISRYKVLLLAITAIIAGSYFIFHYSKPFHQQGIANTNSASDINSVSNGISGESLYLQNCASCHGITLEGEANWRSPKEDGSLPAPPHNQDGHTWHHPDRLLFHITKFGGTSIAPKGFNSNMPAFEGVLSDKEIIAALEFIKSKWPNEIRQRQKNITDKDTAALSQ
ncbi:c-type cytochrome [Kiloniella majae]|uniref:c-type cytochrome n=1 Tax=Kiloniella majae TaxID=1938558 RepID=UPI000A279111|nr:cytochrome c [Kiloniella majae]